MAVGGAELHAQRPAMPDLPGNLEKAFRIERLGPGRRR
jgi:hypothetical protein